MAAEQSFDIYIDQEPDGSVISETAATGAWVSIRDIQGCLHVPASTQFGKAIMAKKLQVIVNPENYSSAVDLSTIPAHANETFQRLRALIEDNLK